MGNNLSDIFQNYPNPTPDLLIPILQDIQEKEGYLSSESLKDVSRYLGVPMSHIYGVATFYNQFRLHPPGKYIIQICRGTACHVYGSVTLLDILQNELGIQVGQTTVDGLFSIDIVSCIGVCGLAPIITINGELIPRITPDRLKQIVDEIKEKENVK